VEEALDESSDFAEEMESSGDTVPQQPYGVGARCHQSKIQPSVHVSVTRKKRVRGHITGQDVSVIRVRYRSVSHARDQLRVTISKSMKLSLKLLVWKKSKYCISAGSGIATSFTVHSLAMKC
jgi:hypothetical protein